MIQKNDWRLRDQGCYLKGKTLFHRNWRTRSLKWDHDHCEFCWGKLSDADGDRHEGYTTENNYHWICHACFRDFEAMFDWDVVEDMES